MTIREETANMKQRTMPDNADNKNERALRRKDDGGRMKDEWNGEGGVMECWNWHRSMAVDGRAGLDAVDASSLFASNCNFLWRKVLDALDALDAGFRREVK